MPPRLANQEDTGNYFIKMGRGVASPDDARPTDRKWHGGIEATAKAVTMGAVWCRFQSWAPNPTENHMSNQTRRDFLQTVLVAAASLILPTRIWAAGGNFKSYWLLHVPSGQSWSISDPASWSLENSGQPLLERGKERLGMLDAADPERVIRLVTRRCKLNLIEIQPEKVVVHYWGQKGQGELRPLFKMHGLSRKNVEVVLTDRKRETSTVKRSQDFLYGERLAERFPVDQYVSKWRNREVEEPDDWQPAPCSSSNYCWPGIEERCIPWAVLKAAWRHEPAPLCLNCDQPTLLIAFGNFPCGLCNLWPTVTRICPLCRSRFADHSPWNGRQWMLANLGESLLPVCEIIFGHRRSVKIPWWPVKKSGRRFF